MRITCPNCKKCYTVNPEKIPSHITTAKCKACSHPMPLHPASADRSSATTDICKIQCMYCSRKYKLDRSKIPPGISSMKCKACGHAMSLQQAKSGPGAAAQESFSVTCLYCNKTYTIDRAKIPKNVATTRCTACGHSISLKPKKSEILTARKQPVSSGAYLHPPDTKKIIQPAAAPPAEEHSKPLWKQPWLLAAVLAVIAIGLGVIYGGPQLTRFAAGWFEEDRDPNAGLQFQATNLPRPFMKLDVNVPLTMETLDQQIPTAKKDPRYTETVAFIEKLNLSRVQLYLFPDRAQTALPVIVINSSNPNSLKSRFKKTVAIKTRLKEMPDGSYQVKRGALPDEMRKDFPVDLYRIIFWEKGALLVPKSFLPELRHPGILKQTLVAQMAASVNSPDHMLAVSFRIPEDMQSGWENGVNDLPGLKQNPQMAMVVSKGGGILARMAEPFEKIDALALAFKFNAKSDRNLIYTQRFRKHVDGKEIYEQLKTGDIDDFDVDGIVLRLIEMFQNPQYRHAAKFNKNMLTLEFSWSAENDEAFLAGLSQATVGQLFAQSRKLEPTAGPIESKYEDAPSLTPSVDTDTLKETVPAAVRQVIFPESYFGGDEPQMTLTLDKVNLPNAALAELTYDVLRIETPDGQNVLRQAQNQVKFKINPGSTAPGHITLFIHRGTPPEKLKSARIRFNLLLPSMLEQLEFQASEAVGSLKRANGVQVRLEKLEKDVARVEYRGGRDVILIAYDGTGRALASRESVNSGASISARFQGVIARLKVIVVKERFDYPFEIDIALNGGKAPELSRKPETPLRQRYDSNPIKDYVTYEEADFDDLDVAWNEGSDTSWNDSLTIQLPKGPFSGQVDWEVHFFAGNKPLYLAGNCLSGPMDTSFSMQKGELQRAHAAFGSVRMNLASVIDRVSFTKKADARQQFVQLGSGTKIYATFNQNEVTLHSGKADIIQTMAFDNLGRRLKKDHYTRHQDGNLIMYFWGIPARFETDIVSRKVSKTVHFDIRQRPVEDKAYLKFQVNAENQSKVVKTLKAIAAAQRKNRTGYRADVAGLYYIYDHKKKKPMKLINKEVAHSDPSGQKRFGYRLKPCKGYYFTVLSGTESNGVKQDYPRQSEKRMYAWRQGSLEMTPFTRSPDLVAIPQDKSQPTFFLRSGQVYMKQLNGSSLKYLPQDYYSQGWVEAKFIEG